MDVTKPPHVQASPATGNACTADPLVELAGKLRELRQILQRHNILVALHGRPLAELQYGNAAFRQRYLDAWAEAIAFAALLTPAEIAFWLGTR